MIHIRREFNERKKHITEVKKEEEEEEETFLVVKNLEEEREFDMTKSENFVD